MPSKSGDCSTFVALALAAAAAVVSIPRQTGATYQTLQRLLSANTAPEAAALAGAIGARPEALLPP
jgi:hypothetical protein